ncbi:MAG: BACON domain-containing protein [Bacteroidales bacterium]|nr:BACON domain-containing protein [Bacteroidales bacterium]
MKRTALFIISLVLFAACEEPLKETPQLKDAGTLEVYFAYGNNNDIVSHTFSPASQSVDIEVQISAEVGWKVYSDADWCVVDDEARHRGSGKFSLAVTANDSFVNRDDATVTFSAGDFTKHLRVIQRGNTFIIDKVYQVSNKTAGSVDVSVRMPEGTQWHLECPDWVTYENGEKTTSDGVDELVVSLNWSSNDAESRFANIGFVEEGADEPEVSFSLYQFGTEYQTTDDGTILLDAEKAAPLEVKVPVNTFTSMVCPEWVTYDKVDNDDNTVSWLLYFADNPSDTESLRDTELEFVVEQSDSHFKLPLIKQDYYPVYGLLTAAGFEMFAQRFNSGGDVSSWVKDGKVSVVGHVNLKDLEDWTPIGTEDRPFNLEFDGAFRQISYFKSSAPLFGVCKGAIIRSLTFTETCSFTLESNFIADVHIASLAGKISETVIADCESFAPISLAASASGTGLSVYAGGLVAEADDKSTISDCAVEGQMTLPVTSKCQGGNLYAGGLVGFLSGKAERCSGNVNILDDMGIKSHYVGGLVGYLSTLGRIENSTNAGKIVYTSKRKIDEVDRYNDVLNLGGIAGYSEGTLNSLKNSGNLEVDSDIRYQYVGGVVGLIKNSGSVSDLVNSGGKIDSYNSGQELCIGGLIGCINLVDLEIDFTGVEPSVLEVNVKPTTSNLNVGGLVGRSYNKLLLKSPKWSGTVNYDISAAASKLTAGFGGIVGRVSYLETDGADAEGSISVKPGSFVNQGQSAYGGILGYCELGAKVSNSVSSCDIKWGGNSGKSNGNVCCLGGIVARINEGVVEITDCSNEGDLWNRHRNDNPWTKGQNISCSATGGIVGLFGSKTGLDAQTSFIKISGCSNSGVVQTSRGLAGGIAGALMNATIKDCEFTGQMPKASGYDNPLIGGVTGVVENSIMEDCKVVADMYGNSVSSVAAYIGGISSLLCSGSQIKACSYFGHLTTDDSKNKGFEVRMASISAVTDADCSISGCGLGGTVNGSTVTKDNYTDYIVGDGAVQATGCYYWDGK